MKDFASNPFQCNTLQTHAIGKPFKTNILAAKIPPGGGGRGQPSKNLQSPEHHQGEEVNRVVITGLGCITPIGNTVADFRTSLFAGATGIAPFPPYPEAPTREAHDKSQGLRFTQPGAVKDFDPRQHLDSGIVVSTDRTTQFAIVAARQAATESQLTNHYAPEKIAIIVGCACGGRQAEETETAKLYTRDARVHPLTVIRTMASAGASNISIDQKITGPALNISTACASGAHAIGHAFQMIRSGMVDAAITGGHEA